MLGPPWPDAAAVAPDGCLVLGGCRADELAAAHGTPLYVYDAATLRARARAYVEPLARRRAGGQAAYALKACSVVGVLRMLAAEGMGADVSSAGELACALRAGFRPASIVAHGNARSDDEIESMVTAGIGLFVIDTGSEPDRVAASARRHGRRQAVAVRVTPGIRAGGHAAIETGGAGSKFGLGPEDAAAAVARCRELPELDWQGLHVHLGSQIADDAPLRAMVGWFARFCSDNDLDPALLDLGGGLGIAYGGERPPDAGDLADGLARALDEAFPRARLLLEPGRSVTGPAGVTLYRVVSTKRAPDGTRWAALDGGMSDNMRPALYGARYTAAAALRMDDAPSEPVSLAGRHCESGDVLLADARLSELRAGELVAFAATGAYAQSMASTYNVTPRAAAVIVDDGAATVVTRRETLDELLSRDV